MHSVPSARPPLVTDVLTEAVRRFAAAPPFARYVDPEHLIVTGLRGRSGPHGKRAQCHFTRFADSGAKTSRDGRWKLPEIRVDRREIRYVVSFVLPRFLFLDPEDQARDIVHELLHIDESYSGVGSRRRHGPAYDRAVEAIALRALDRGIEMPKLPRAGDAARPILYRRFRPFPHPFRAEDRDARRAFDESDLEIAALRLDPAQGEPPPPRFVYRCPVCEASYRRQRPLSSASCGRCCKRYDGRFKLVLVGGSASADRRAHRTAP